MKNKILFVAFLVFASVSLPVKAQNGSWTQISPFPGTPRAWSASFVIGTKVYIGTGSDGQNFTTNDLYEYDQATGQWAQKQSLPASAARTGGVGFAVGNKGYMATGLGVNTALNDLWEYDPNDTSNGFDVNGNPMGEWTQKANFPGSGRDDATAFVVGTKAYVGLGAYSGPQFYEYDPQADSWTPISPFPGPARVGAASFTIGNKAYVGIGAADYSGANGVYEEFWEYDPATDTWTQKANFGGGRRFFAGRFSIGGKGYVGTGIDDAFIYNDFWEYDPATDTWSPKAAFGGGYRAWQVGGGFAIGNTGYLGLGADASFNRYNDLWTYQINTSIAASEFEENQVQIFPNPFSTSATITFPPIYASDKISIELYDIFGNKVQEFTDINIVNNRFEFTKGNLDEGTYFYRIVNLTRNKTEQGKLILIE
jgi:N-acetylneuraminic acid mutarotase